MEDSNADDSGYSIRTKSSKQKQLAYFLGRMEKKGSDTIPLLKHAIERDFQQEKESKRASKSNDKKQRNKSQVPNGVKEKAVIYSGVCEVLHKNTDQQSIKQSILDKASITKDLRNFIRKIMSTMDIFLYSLYEITKKPLHITNSKYTTNIAKYLRKRKLIRHKKSFEKDFKYFISCSNNNINTHNKILKKGDDNRDHGNDANDLQKTKKDAKKDIPNIELKCFHDETALESFGSKNEAGTSKMKRHNLYIDQFHTALSKYWINVKLSVFNKSAITIKEHLPPTKENRHKRKKKRKKTKRKKEKYGNSRLFNFLDERTWINCYDNNDDKIVHSAEREIALKNQTFSKELVVVNSVSIFPQ